MPGARRKVRDAVRWAARMSAVDTRSVEALEHVTGATMGSTPIAPAIGRCSWPAGPWRPRAFPRKGVTPQRSPGWSRARMGSAMKTIGLLGGMSWESSIVYEQIINQEVRRLGGLHSADLLIRSYDFAVVERLQVAGAWGQAGRLLATDARRLERRRRRPAGAGRNPGPVAGALPRDHRPAPRPGRRRGHRRVHRDRVARYRRRCRPALLPDHPAARPGRSRPRAIRQLMT